MSDPLRPIGSEELPSRMPLPRHSATPPSNKPDAVSPIQSHPDLPTSGSGTPHVRDQKEARKTQKRDRVELALRWQHLLYAFDFDGISDQNLTMALGLARTHGAKLTVIHILDSESSDDDLQANLQTMNTMISERSSPEEFIHTIVDRGTPADRLCHHARQIPADLIILSTHGRKGIERLILGSVAEAVTRDAHCPVLTLRE